MDWPICGSDPLTCRPPAGANEFAAGNSQSPPSWTRRPDRVPRSMHRRVRNRGLPDQSKEHGSPLENRKSSFAVADGLSRATGHEDPDGRFLGRALILRNRRAWVRRSLEMTDSDARTLPERDRSLPLSRLRERGPWGEGPRGRSSIPFVEPLAGRHAAPAESDLEAGGGAAVATGRGASFNMRHPVRAGERAVGRCRTVGGGNPLVRPGRKRLLDGRWTMFYR
jgi:hypothetical protein